MEFKEITIGDKIWIDEIFKKAYSASALSPLSCDWGFGNFFIWKKSYGIKLANLGDFFVAQFANDAGGDTPSFYYPVGSGEIKPIIEKLFVYCEENLIDFLMHDLTSENVFELETLFPGKFTFKDNRDFADYVYGAKDLAELAGKKYHSKRNHLTKFYALDWSFEEITEENISDCAKMSLEWCKQNDCGKDEAKKEESCAVKCALKHFEELDFFGGLLRVDGRVVSFAIGERLNERAVVTHIEKAFADVPGAYAAINREFALNLCFEKGYEFINREEDMGVEGLRKAKLSYHPQILLEKFEAKLKA